MPNKEMVIYSQKDILVIGNLINSLEFKGVEAARKIATIGTLPVSYTHLKHGVKYKDVQALYDQYADEGGTQMDLMVDVIMEIMLVSGFFTENQRESVMDKREDLKDEM